MPLTLKNKHLTNDIIKGEDGFKEIEKEITDGLSSLHNDIFNLNIETKEKTNNKKIYKEIEAGNFDNISRLTKLTKNSARRIANSLKLETMINLNGLKEINTNIAAILVNTRSLKLSLNGLTKLSTNETKQLSLFHGFLYLNGLTKLDTKIANKLSNFKGDGLSLNGLTRLDAETIKELTKYSFQIETMHLNLNGLTELNTKEAVELFKFNGSLSLNGFKTLTPEMIIGLKNSKIEHLTLNGIIIMPPEILEELEKLDIPLMGGGLDLNGLTKLNKRFASILAKYNYNYLSLSGVTDLTIETATELAQFKGKNIYLPGLNEKSKKIRYNVRSK